MRYGRLSLTPNANQVAAQLAAASAMNGLKTIVFVNTKADAVSTAGEISDRIGGKLSPTRAEADRWTALEAELGDLKHSLLDGATPAVAHNSAMLRLERDLAERMFRRVEGAKVIVATPTLAQGLNLPAQLAILAGDKRASESTGRESLGAHEILNAAARAGRAGHLANGVVLLVPEPIVSIEDGKPLQGDVLQKLQSVLPEDDRCVSVSDPLEMVLDRLASGNTLDRDVQYTINRMVVLEEVEDSSRSASTFQLDRSLAAFMAKRKAAEAEFKGKVAVLQAAIETSKTEGHDVDLLALVSKSGLPGSVLDRLRKKISDEVGSLPTSIADWVVWTLDWLGSDTEAQSHLLFDVKGDILAAVGLKKTEPLTALVLTKLRPGVLAWIAGQSIRDIEIALGGNPHSGTDTQQTCPRAREVVSTVIPRGLSFIMGIVSYIVRQLDPFDKQDDLNSELIDGLATAVRRGFDSVEKLSFALDNKAILSRVLVHKAWTQAQADLSGLF